MKGLMQEQPLNIPMILRHAEQLHGRKTVTTKTDDGVSVRTFAETAERARRLMTALRGLGVKEDDRVATFCWNNQQHLETYVAAPCIGAILHTLNIRLFEQDLQYIVNHAQDKVVVVDKSLWPQWEKVAAKADSVRQVICVNDTPGPVPEGTLDYEELIASHEPLEVLPDIPEDHAAAMCYTSGTTGHPKGVLYSHRSNVLHSFMAAMVDGIGLSETDTVLPIVPMFHANAWGLPYASLFTGANLVMPARFMTPDALTPLLVEQKVTLAFGVPTIWLGMTEPLKAVKDQLSLRSIICGGSAVPPVLQKAYLDGIGVRIVHAWGMTETSPLASICRPDGDPRRAFPRGPRPGAHQPGAHPARRRVATGGRPARRCRGTARRSVRSRSAATGSRPPTTRTTAPRRSSSTAGCARATSRPSTPTATSRSSTAPRTWSSPAASGSPASSWKG